MYAFKVLFSRSMSSNIKVLRQLNDKNVIQHQPDLVGTSAAVRELREEIACAARFDGKVLISGESGSGKEITARLIHSESSRNRVPLVTLNCAGVPETLLESELFGHVRGSFTGAYQDHAGLFEVANGGTVFLDEIGEMSLRMQSILLRFLETGEIQRVGSARTELRVDVRIIAATNRDLMTLVAAKEFRQDLYYRLNVLNIVVPPLRNRREDIPALVEHLGHRLADQFGIAAPAIAPEAMRRLLEHDWPGNVRELRNVLERTIARRGAAEIGVDDLPREMRRVEETPSRLVAAPPDRVDELFSRMVTGGEAFWTVVYHPFIARDLTRETLQAVVRRGLEHTLGSYRILVRLFNMPPDDYYRFLNFLRKHHLQVPFQGFRVPAPKANAVRVQDGLPHGYSVRNVVGA
jgi:transcriptional regulator with GAF, ATPase, and Fis domain